MLGKYIYGIVRNTSNDQPLKIDGLSTMGFRGLSAVIANTEYKDYHSLPKEDVIGELISHQQMMEKIMKQLTVLPVKFGTILKNEGEIKLVLEKGYLFLQDILQTMEDRIELDLVSFWDEKKAAQMAFQESKNIQDLQKAIPNDKITLGKGIAKYLNEKRENLSSQILEVLKKKALESRSHALVHANMIFNQAFLVDKENEEAFNHTLDKLDGKFNGLINFRLVGPLPPYSFATIAIDFLDKEKIEKAKKLFKLEDQIDKNNVKKAYDKLAFTLHPDYGGDPIDFEQVTKSYKLLRKYVEHGLASVSLYNI